MYVFFFFRDFPEKIMQCLGWCHIMTPEGCFFFFFFQKTHGWLKSEFFEFFLAGEKDRSCFFSQTLHFLGVQCYYWGYMDCLAELTVFHDGRLQKNHPLTFPPKKLKKTNGWFFWSAEDFPVETFRFFLAGR